MLRVVLDSNIILSGLIKPAGVPGQIVTAWRNSAFRLALSEFLLAEIAETLLRPKLAQLIRWSPETVSRFVLELRAACEVVEPAALPHHRRHRRRASVRGHRLSRGSGPDHFPRKVPAGGDRRV